MFLKLIKITIICVVLFFSSKSYAQNNIDNEILTVKILNILKELPTCYKEEKNIDQLTLISTAISNNSITLSDAAALLTIGTFESSWCYNVGSGKRTGGFGRGYWQI